MLFLLGRIVNCKHPLLLFLLSVCLLLQPRTFKYKNKQKKRSLLTWHKNYKLNFGNYGLLTLQPAYLSAHHLFRFKLFLKRAVKKSDRTRRFLWFHAFPHLPLTRKPDGLRMGKGKGKLDCWFTALPGGIVLFEFKNLRTGRAKLFVTQFTYKLGIKTQFISSYTRFVASPINSSVKIRFKTFW